MLETRHRLRDRTEISQHRQQLLDNLIEELKTAALHLEFAHEIVYEAGTSAQPIDASFAQGIAWITTEVINLNRHVVRMQIRISDEVEALRKNTQGGS